MRVGKYELGKTIGRGAFGKVKVCTSTETGQEVVIKIIEKNPGRAAGNPSPSNKAKKVEQEVRLEISVMKLLDHENIVKLFEVMESTNHYYIVLESVRGGDLCDHIMSAGKLTEDISKKYFFHLLNGLQACHDAGVAHRDIKPENCLISTKGVLKVADFGLSRLHRGKGQLAGPQDLSMDAVGTLSYAAPEVLSGPYDAFKADLWSLGVVVFVMTTGKFPFGSKGYTDAQIQEDIKKGKINKFPSHLSESIKNLIMCLIIVDANRRMTLQDLMYHEWLGQYALVRQEQPRLEGRKRPMPINMEEMKNRAVAGIDAAVDDTASPTWADSPQGALRAKYFPPLFSPTHGPASPHTGAAASPQQSPRGTGKLAGLKGALEAEGRRMQQGN
eukprot:TRINITY_DN7709_c1_g1_i1.p2 TRINITY_DN7709_c1_g1~~TRINITY_DN7709_c1_g1_i1.p2  ORF type:complete len:387 (+),score=185.27 TRINITY_DN7709_c1_g1_i1:56-1216(+)